MQVSADMKGLRMREAVAAKREAEARKEASVLGASIADVQRQLGVLARRVQRRRQLGFPESSADLPARTAELSARVASLRARRDALQRIAQRMTSREGLSAAAAAETAHMIEEAEGASPSSTASPTPSPSAGPLGVGSPVSIDPSTGVIVPDGTPGSVPGRVVEVIHSNPVVGAARVAAPVASAGSTSTLPGGLSR